MNFIKEWESIVEIKRNTSYIGASLYRCLNGQVVTTYGYIWKYKNDVKNNVNYCKDEIFKAVGMFDGRNFIDYEVSNCGKVKSLKSGKILRLNEKVYNYVSLYDKNGKAYKILVHRLVAHVFVNGRTKEKNLVNHIDENKLNNYYKNLEWVTPKQNTIHSHGRTVNQIDIDSGEVINTFRSITEASKHLKIKHGSSINACCRGKQLTAYGYKWEYKS